MTNHAGKGRQEFLGRFSIETFIVAPNVALAPVVHNQPPFPDADSNPKTAPAHSLGHSRDGEATGQVSAWSAFATWMYS